MSRNILLSACLRVFLALGFGALVVGATAFRTWAFDETGVESKAGSLTASPAGEVAPVERLPSRNSCDLPSGDAEELADETYYCCPTTYNDCLSCCRASYPWRSSGGWCYQTQYGCMKDKTGMCYFCNGGKC